MLFKDRQEAGARIAGKLERFANQSPVVIALPRGGVPIGFEVARALQAPLDIVGVRKIGAPDNPEFGIGAVAEDGVPWLNHSSMEALGIRSSQLARIIREETEEAARRARLFRRHAPPIPVDGRTVILVDDGLATGVTAAAASRFLRKRGAKRIILAIPVCAHETAGFIRSEVDEVICLEMPMQLGAVGFWYDDFTQLTDDEVIDLLDRARGFATTTAHRDFFVSEQVVIPAVRQTAIELIGDLHIPPQATGLVLFAHGSGSSRKSPRNMRVAKALNQARLGTLLFDLLTDQESENRENVFNIELLASRLIGAHRWAKEWIKSNFDRQSLPMGFFGASTGAAAALIAAAELGPEIHAVVSRGGRPDLAGSRLLEVQSPTLLIVGGNDEGVIELNEKALRMLRSADLIIVPGATHLFEEPGALEKVSQHAAHWFKTHFAPYAAAAAA